MEHRIELSHSFDLNADYVRVYKSNTDTSFNDSLVQQMANNAITKSSRCRSDFRGTCSAEVKAALTQIFDAAFMAYVNELYDADLIENFEFWQDWSVSVYRDGRSLFSHTHNETFVTACYYPKTPTGLPQYTLSSPLVPFKTGEIVLSNSDGFPLTGRYAKDKSRMHFHYLPQEGDVIIFPGHVPHWTVPGEPENRYCLASFISPKPKNSELMKLNAG